MMRESEKQFQPGLHKLIYHPQHVANIINAVPVAPLHISVWPTKKCQCHCEFCAFRNEPRHDCSQELDAPTLISVIKEMQPMGLKAVEFSGGGEPTLWDGFNQAVNALHDIGLSLSLITNGYSLQEYSRETLDKFDWIRVSVHSPDHFLQIMRTCPAKFQTSYIFGSNESDTNNMREIMDIANSAGMRLRVAVEQPATAEKTIYVRANVPRPHIFTEKKYGAPRGCYMAWIRAAIDWRGNFLPCPATQLQPESTGRVAGDAKICHYTKAVEWLKNNPPRDMGFRCSHCICGHDMNNYIHELKYDRPEDVDFV